MEEQQRQEAMFQKNDQDTEVPSQEPSHAYSKVPADVHQAAEEGTDFFSEFDYQPKP